MKVTTYETLYHGAILKHKCGKRDSSIVPSLFFSHFIIFYFFSFFLWPFFFLFGLSLFFLFFLFVKSEVSSRLVGESQSSSSFPYQDNALIMKIITLLWIYNSKLEQGMTLYECLRRCTGICNESRVTCMKIMKVALPQIRCQLHDHAMRNMTMMERVIINGTVESCMAIYLRMAMEMP